MQHEYLRVSDLPFEPVPDYSRKWETPPDEWFATVNVATERYRGDFVGDHVTFTATDPEEAPHSPLIETIGLIVVREYAAPSYENTLEALQDRSVFNGEVLGRFEYFPRFFSMEFPEGSLYPSFQEAKKSANAFAHGVRTERNRTDA